MLVGFYSASTRLLRIFTPRYLKLLYRPPFVLFNANQLILEYSGVKRELEPSDAKMAPPKNPQKKKTVEAGKPSL